MNSDFTIRVEEPRDFRTVETLTRESFWNVYHPGMFSKAVLYKAHADYSKTEAVLFC